MGAFIYGRLTQQVKNNSEAIGEVKADVRELKSTTAQHGTDIALIKQHLDLDK